MPSSKDMNKSIERNFEFLLVHLRCQKYNYHTKFYVEPTFLARIKLLGNSLEEISNTANIKPQCLSTNPLVKYQS